MFGDFCSSPLLRPLLFGRYCPSSNACAKTFASKAPVRNKLVGHGSV